MAPEHSSQPHLPPAWPEMPREEPDRSQGAWDAPPGRAGAAREEPSGWPETPSGGAEPRDRLPRDEAPPPWPGTAGGAAGPHSPPSRPQEPAPWPARNDTPPDGAPPAWPQPPREEPAQAWPSARNDAAPPPWDAGDHAARSAHSPDPYPAPSSEPRIDDAAQARQADSRADRPAGEASSWEDEALHTVRSIPVPPPSATSDVNYERTVALPIGKPPRPSDEPPAPPGAERPRSPHPAPPEQTSGPGNPPRPGRPPGPRQGPPPEHPARRPGPPGRPEGAGEPRRPNSDLGRDPADPNRPFVTAGQISGPKTPPPERQQQLWNTVFGENYQQIDDEELEQSGRPVWLYALAGSAALALLAALLWAFLAGPFAGDGEETDPADRPATEKADAKPRQQAIGRLPKYKGEASPVTGTLTVEDAGVTLPRFGAPWRLDQRPTVAAKYGYGVRQYARAGTDPATGKAQYAQVLAGTLPKELADKYTSPDDLTPVINAVAYQARTKFFPEGNKIRKTAQQPLSVGELPGRLVAYEVTAGESKTTVVVAALSTGADYPAIVYMSVPDSGRKLLPDVNTLVNRLRLSTTS